MQVAGAIGVAVLGTISTEHTRTLVAHDHPLAGALTSGYHLAFLVAAGAVAAGILVSIVLLRPRRPARASVPAPARLEASGEAG
jgi:ABC-type spermidine/putrescine transport system permease subunit II